MIGRAEKKIYVSAWADDLKVLADVIHEAEDRGVEVFVLTFGRTSFNLKRGAVYRHASTKKVVYPSHQNRHLAVIADGSRALWAVAVGGSEWSALLFEDRRLIGLVRAFIRHDIYVQKIYDEMAPELESVFGPGLEGLTNLSMDLASPAPLGATSSDESGREQSAG